MALVAAPINMDAEGLDAFRLEFPRNILIFTSASDYVRITSFETVPLNGFLFLTDLLPESERTAWRKGTFAESFPDLNAITKDRQSATFKVWDDALREELERSSDSFEAVGLKVPAQAATLWGEILILGVQLYLLIHLIELSRKIDRSDPGWEVAWIGIYRHRLAKTLFVCSAILLPPVTSGIVGYKGVVISANTTNLNRAQAWTVAAAGVLFSVAIAAISFWNRPRTVTRNRDRFEQGSQARE
jgi:hypothetical protein